MDAGLASRIAIVAIVGALLSLDRRAAVQAMFAHPVVAAFLTGVLLGNAAAGLTVAVLIGLLWSGALPVGGVVPPDETLGAVTGAAVAALGPDAGTAHHAILACAMAGALVAILASYAGRRVELALRRYNGELARRVEKQVRDGDLRAVNRAIARSLGVAFGGYFLAHVVVLAVAIPAVRALFAHAPAAVPVLERAAYPVPLAGLGTVVSGAGFRLGIAWATLGFAIGLLLTGALRFA